MSGFLISLCTLAALGLLGIGLLSAACQLISRDDEMENADDFGDFHSKEY